MCAVASDVSGPCAAPRRQRETNVVTNKSLANDAGSHVDGAPSRGRAHRRRARPHAARERERHGRPRRVPVDSGRGIREEQVGHFRRFRHAPSMPARGARRQQRRREKTRASTFDGCGPATIPISFASRRRRAARARARSGSTRKDTSTTRASASSTRGSKRRCTRGSRATPTMDGSSSRTDTTGRISPSTTCRTSFAVFASSRAVSSCG